MPTLDISKVGNVVHFTNAAGQIRASSGKAYYYFSTDDKLTITVETPLHSNETIRYVELPLADITIGGDAKATASDALTALSTVFLNANSSSGGSGIPGTDHVRFLGSLTTTQRDALSSPVAGSQIFNTTDGWYEYYDSFWGWMPIAVTNEWRRKYGFEAFTDFTSTSANELGSFATSGAGANAGNSSASGTNMGLMTMNPGTTSTGSAGHYPHPSSLNQFITGAGKLAMAKRIRFPFLSNATDRFQVFAGFGTTRNSLNQGRGFWFLYDEGGVTTGSAASPNWQLVTAVNSVRSFYTTSIPVALNTFYELECRINEGATEVSFYINGALVHTSTTNIPTNASGSIGPQVFVMKSAGTSEIWTQIDYLAVKQKFTTPR